MKIADEKAYFDSGCVFDCHGGIIGIREPHLTFTEGWDSGFGPDPDEDDRLTQAERRELADYMIGVWERFAEMVS